MKWIFLLSLMFLLSCESPTNTEDTVTADPKPVSADEIERINLICNALMYKNESIGVLIDSNYTFSYSKKSCADDDFGRATDVPVTIRRDGYQYSFFKNDGAPFVFANIEMINSGVMKEICAGIGSGNLESPIDIDGVMTWFTTYTKRGDCESDAEHMCIHLKRGTPNSDDSYDRHTEEWIQFKIRGERVGFFTSRKIVSQGDCGKNKTSAKMATLK
ncbi:MAG: hypothetical protein AB7I27_01330 [Bacteriovoracaceae bacterium]